MRECDKKTTTNARHLLAGVSGLGFVLKDDILSERLGSLYLCTAHIANKKTTNPSAQQLQQQTVSLECVRDDCHKHVQYRYILLIPLSLKFAGVIHNKQVFYNNRVPMN